MTHAFPLFGSPSHRSFHRVCLTVLLAAGSAVGAFGQGTGYHLVKIVDELTPRPDGMGTFAFNGSYSSTPTLDGGKVVFRPGTGDSIWAANLDGSRLTKLAGLGTAAPGGLGNFTSLTIGNSGGLPVVKDGTVVFPATSPGSNPNIPDIGLYTVPVGGGPVSRIADRNTPEPDDSGSLDFSSFGDPNAETGNFSFSMGKVAFVGSNHDVSGIYIAGTNGNDLAALADNTHPAHPEFDFPVVNFAVPAIHNGTTAFYGNTVFDPSNGYSGLYTTTGAFVYTEVATSNTALPDNPDTTPHTRFDVPPLDFDGTRLAFLADDADASPGFKGLYTLPAAGGAPTPIVNFGKPLPGLSATQFGVGGFALDNEQLAIAAFDQTQTAIYLAPANGSAPPVRLVGTGDAIDFGNAVVAGVSLITGGFSGGQIGVMIYYGPNTPAAGGFAGIYVVRPGTITPVVGGNTTDSTGTSRQYSYRILADNFPTSFGVQGLPGGLTVNATTGIISGTPKNPGTYTLTLNAYNSAGKGSGTLSLFVAADAPRITSAATAAGTTGKPFSYQITATGSPTSYGVQGLPGGLSVNASTGVIAGTPKVAGTYNLTPNAYNNSGKGSAPLTLTVALGAPTITSPTTASGKVGTAFSYQITATGSPTSYGVQGLGDGLTVDAKTGIISGTPKGFGTLSLTLNAYNSAGKGSETLTVRVTDSMHP